MAINDRYTTRVRVMGRWPFRRRAWQVWDMVLNEWVKKDTGGSLEIAEMVAERLNENARRWKQHYKDGTPITGTITGRVPRDPPMQYIPVERKEES